MGQDVNSAYLSLCRVLRLFSDKRSQSSSRVRYIVIVSFKKFFSRNSSSRPILDILAKVWGFSIFSFCIPPGEILGLSLLKTSKHANTIVILIIVSFQVPVEVKIRPMHRVIVFFSFEHYFIWNIIFEGRIGLTRISKLALRLWLGLISFPDFLWTKPKARSGKVRKFIFLDWLLHLTPVQSPL